MEVIAYLESFVRNHMGFVLKEVNNDMEACQGHQQEIPTTKESSTQAIRRKTPFEAM